MLLGNENKENVVPSARVVAESTMETDRCLPSCSQESEFGGGWVDEAMLEFPI
jgi:hypothetical protein